MSTVDQLRAALAALSLDTRGHKKVLAKRLAKAKQPTKQPTSPPATRPEGEEFDSFLVCDVEGTCERIEGEFTRLAFAYPNEIIEFPCILLQWRKHFKQAPDPDGRAGDDPPDGEGEDDDDGASDRSSTSSSSSSEAGEGEVEWRLEVVDEFHSFVKPTWRPKLSAFCTELTGIEQSDVSAAPTYPELLRLFKASFVDKHALFTRENRTVWVTDGPWDLRDFIAKATFINLTPRPSWLAGPVIDLKLLASAYFASQNKAKAAAATNGNGHRTPSPPLRPAPSPLAGARSPSTPKPSVTRSESTLSATAAAFTVPASTPKVISPFASPPTSRPSTPLSAKAPAFPTPSTATPSSPTPASPSARPPPTLSIPALLDALALPPFQGRQHSGQDDTRNAARILVELAKRGWPLVANRMVPEGGRGSKERRWGWMKFGKGEVSTGVVDWDGFVERERRKLGAQGAKRFV